MMDRIGILDSGDCRIIETQVARSTRGTLVPAYDGQVHDALSPPHAIERTMDMTVYLVSLKNAYVSVKPWADGIVITSDGKMVTETSFHSGRADQCEDFDKIRREAVVLDKPVFTSVDGTWLNYYHWTVFGLGKAGMADAYLPADCEFVAPSYDAHASEELWRLYAENVHASSLKMLDLRRPIRLLDANFYRAPEIHLLWISSGQPAHLTYLQSFFRPFTRYARSIPTTAGHRLYVQRRENTRLSAQETLEVAQVVTAHGFQTVQLEDVDFAGQTALFANATHIVGAHGAGLSNLVYARPDARILELNSSLDGDGLLRPWFYLLAQGLGQKYAYLNGSLGEINAARLDEALARLSA